MPRTIQSDVDSDEHTVSFRVPAGKLLENLQARATDKHISLHAAARELLLKALGGEVQDGVISELRNMRLELTRLALEISHLQFHLAPGQGRRMEPGSESSSPG